MYKLPKRRGRGGRGNSGIARKKTFFFQEVFPYTGEWPQVLFVPTDAIRVAASPRIGVGPGFDSQGSVNFFPNTAFPTYTESMSKLLG